MVIPLYFLPLLSSLPTTIRKQLTLRQHSIQGDNYSACQLVCAISLAYNIYGLHGLRSFPLFNIVIKYLIAAGYI